jgi:hypothetical protein
VFNRSELNEEQIAEAIERIGKMSQRELASLQRFAPVGSIYFDTFYPTIREAWEARIKVVGGMTPAISKELSW